MPGTCLEMLTLADVHTEKDPLNMHSDAVVTVVGKVMCELTLCRVSTGIQCSSSPFLSGI